jgi:enoyl-CoA hydratase/carnithine racemase
MQQAYRTIRVVAEAQTVRIALAESPGSLMLRELATACAAFGAESSSEVKAVILDFGALADAAARGEQIAPEPITRVVAAMRAVAPPTLAVARGALSASASALALAADLILMADTASLAMPRARLDDGTSGYETVTATEAAQRSFVTWVVSQRALGGELERVLDMLREKSAVALRLAKASVQIADQVIEARPGDSASRLEALRQVNDFYLSHVAPSTDAGEGLRAFLEKRKPRWKNR